MSTWVRQHLISTQVQELYAGVAIHNFRSKSVDGVFIPSETLGLDLPTANNRSVFYSSRKPEVFSMYKKR